MGINRKADSEAPHRRRRTVEQCTRTASRLGPSYIVGRERRGFQAWRRLTRSCRAKTACENGTSPVENRARVCLLKLPR